LVLENEGGAGVGLTVPPVLMKIAFFLFGLNIVGIIYNLGMLQLS